MPTTVRAPYGVLVITVVQGVTGPPRVELRTQVRLSGDDPGASAALVADEVDRAIRGALFAVGWIDAEPFRALTAMGG